jgi:hypothetical protein
MSSYPMHPDERHALDQAGVGLLASHCFYALVIFLFLQIGVWIPLEFFVVIISALFNISSKLISGISLAYMLVSELAIIIILTRLTRRRFLSDFAQLKTGDTGPTYARGFAFNETAVEWLMVVTAAASMAWVIAMGLPFASAKVALVVVESFSVAFLVLFSLARLAITKEIRWRALLAIVLSVLSVMSLIRSLAT